MSDEHDMSVIEPKTQRSWTEAPASATVKAKYRTREWMITLRGETGAEVISKIDKVSDWLDKHAEALNVEPTAPIAGAPVPPTPAPQAAPTGAQRVQCVMIEVGTSYTGGKTQLKFSCNGLEHPLTYTKAVGDMVKLLAPLGFTTAHIVVGQKYPVNCYVTYSERTNDGKTYKNVDKVEVA